MVIIFWLDPAGLASPDLDLIRLFLLVFFFVFVCAYLVRFLSKSADVNMNVILVAINIYLLMGIISGSLAFNLYIFLPEAYNLPANIGTPDLSSFLYFSFVTMSTLGYGDFTPTCPQTQTLSYLTAITGQLYVAIIIAFLVGKLLMSNPKAGSRQ